VHALHVPPGRAAGWPRPAAGASPSSWPASRSSRTCAPCCGCSSGAGTASGGCPACGTGASAAGEQGHAGVGVSGIGTACSAIPRAVAGASGGAMLQVSADAGACASGWRVKSTHATPPHTWVVPMPSSAAAASSVRCCTPFTWASDTTCACGWTWARHVRRV